LNNSRAIVTGSQHRSLEKIFWGYSRKSVYQNKIAKFPHRSSLDGGSDKTIKIWGVPHDSNLLIMTLFWVLVAALMEHGDSGTSRRVFDSLIT